MLRKLSVGLFLGLLMTACGAARPIHRDQQGGVLELQGDHGKAMEDAGQQMAAHCGPNNFTIVSEGEEAVGTDTIATEDQSTQEKTSRNGRRTRSDTTTTNTTSTRTATAWRVHYQCGAPGVGGPPPGPPGAMPDQGPPPAAPPPSGGW